MCSVLYSKTSRKILLQNSPASLRNLSKPPRRSLPTSGTDFSAVPPCFLCFPKNFSGHTHKLSITRNVCIRRSLHKKNFLPDRSSRGKFIYCGNVQDVFSRGHPLSARNTINYLITFIAFFKMQFYHISFNCATIFSKCMPWDALTKIASPSFKTEGKPSNASSRVAK